MIIALAVAGSDAAPGDRGADGAGSEAQWFGQLTLTANGVTGLPTLTRTRTLTLTLTLTLALTLTLTLTLTHPVRRPARRAARR